MEEYIEYIFIAVIFGGVVISTIVALYQLRKFNRELKRGFEKGMRKALDENIERIMPLLTNKVPIAQRKKEVIRKITPKTFYYIDKNQVEDLYPQVVQEFEPTRIETKEGEETKKGIFARFFIGGKYERGKVTETTKVFDLKQRISTMYNKVEKHLLEKGKTTFALEEFIFDKFLIDEFESMYNQMRDKFNFDFPDSLRDVAVIEKMEQFALQRVEELSNSSGYAAIQTEFYIIEILDDTYILSFVHPLNEYLPKKSKIVKIQITCPKEYMTPSGVNTFKKGKSVKITCLGKVVSWDSEDRILEISPIAIY